MFIFVNIDVNVEVVKELYTFISIDNVLMISFLASVFPKCFQKAISYCE